jgi:hypothetical protein
MRNRTFGVEIECGYNGSGNGSECTCECYCDEYRCCYCMYGCEESLGEDEDCSCECNCEQCHFCANGCDGECDGAYRGSEGPGCEVAVNLLEHNGFGHWTADIHNDGSGVEIPSPVLSGHTGLRELRQVMELLNSNGFHTTRSDGMHVHHGAGEFAEDERLLATLIELWEENVEHIERMVDPYRRQGHSGHSWCGRRSTSTESWPKFKETKNVAELPGGRYYSLNTSGLQYGRNTVEIRLHEGTLDFQKAYAWIHFGQSFLEWAKLMHKRNNIVTCASAGELLRLTRTSQKSKRTLLSVAAA